MDPASTAIVGEFFRQGVLGIIIVGLLIGWLVPKYVVDELRTRLELKDKIIERQSAVIERLALAKGKALPPDDDV